MPLELNGTSDYANFGNVADLNFGGVAFSISAWIKIDDNTDSQQIITKRQTGNLADRGFFVGYSGTSKMFLEISSAANEDRISSTATPANGVYHHYVLIRNGVNSKIFIDAEQDDDGANLGVGSISNTTDFVIGNRADLDANLFFGGGVDEVIIYDRALTKKEVVALFKPRLKRMGDQVATGNRVLDLRLDNGEDGTSANGDTIKDSSGLGHDSVTVVGGIWRAETVLSYPIGPIPVVLSALVIIGWVDVGIPSSNYVDIDIPSASWITVGIPSTNWIDEGIVT